MIVCCLNNYPDQSTLVVGHSVSLGPIDKMETCENSSSKRLCIDAYFMVCFVHIKIDCKSSNQYGMTVISIWG